MTTLLDEQYILHSGGMEKNCLKNILDQNINTHDENNICQLIRHSSYYDIDQFSSLVGTYKNELTIFSSNIQSINAKFNELEIFVEELDNINFKFSIICLQESCIAEGSDMTLSQLTGYTCITQGKSSSEKGGLVIYLDTKFRFEIIHKLNEFEHWEGQMIRVSKGGLPNSVIVCNIYRPPIMLHDQIRQFIDQLTTVLINIENKKTDVILAGDYNLNLLKLNENYMCSEFFDMLTSHGFLPQITMPTRFGQISGTLIDNFFFKSDNFSDTTKSGIFLKKLSDHQPYFLLIDIRLIKERTPKFIQINNQTEKAMDAVKNELITCNLYNKLDTNLLADVNANYEILQDAIRTAKDKHMPTKLVKFNKYKHKKAKWITQGLLNSIRFRDRLYARLKREKPNTLEYNTIFINLKTFNSILKRSIRAANKIHFEITFTKFHNDIKNTWKTINTIFSRNTKKESFPKKLSEDGNAIGITNPLDIANHFNEFFTSIGQNLANSINYSGDKNHRYYLQTDQSKIFKFKEITEKCIEMVINNLSPKNSFGYDGISTILLKHISPSIVKLITLLTNQIINTGVFPNKLKLAKVIPILKKDDPTYVTNYRPISLLPTISKVIDKIFATQLSDYFEENNLFAPNQYGFRMGHSTEHAALDLVDRIVTQMDKNETPINIFLDLSKAFDTIDHNILIDKLNYYGLAGYPLDGLCGGYTKNHYEKWPLYTVGYRLVCNFAVTQG